MIKTLRKLALDWSGVVVMLGLAWLCSLLLDHPVLILLIGCTFGVGGVAALYIAMQRSRARLKPTDTQTDPALKPATYFVLACTIAIAVYLLSESRGHYLYYRRSPLIAACMIYAPSVLIGAALAGLFAFYRGFRVRAVTRVQG
ncbi:hypothetical protein ACVWZA_002441 [Sphingomonas sp. UYAg733]